MARRRAALVLLAVWALFVPACSGDDGASPAASTTSSTSTTTVPARPAATIAGDSLVQASDVPEGWTTAPADPLDDLSPVCRDVQAERRRAERRAGGGPVSAAVQHDAPVGLPALRVEASVYRSARAAEIAFDQRAGQRSALCTAKAAVRALRAADGVTVSRADVRPARAGRLGDEAKSWIVSTRVERNGVAIDVRLERVAIRVDRVITTVLVASSPSFAITPEQRARLLAASVHQTVQALEAP